MKPLYRERGITDCPIRDTVTLDGATAPVMVHGLSVPSHTPGLVRRWFGLVRLILRPRISPYAHLLKVRI